jgi:ribosomal protein S18 acetylase RimI-like enzyme
MEEMDVTIRRAVAQDYHQLCKTINAVDALHRENHPHLFQKPAGPAREEDYILGLMADEGVGLFVAEVAGQLTGFVTVMVADSRAIPILVSRRYAIIDNLAVVEEFQRSGIGRALMQRASQWATTHGASTIELNVFEFNQAAIAFYRSLGYETLTRRMSKSLEHDSDSSAQYPISNL